MGLLDDAIREHLELKRLRGADPGEVAQEEHEALGPVHHDEEMHAGQVEAQTGTAPSDFDVSGPDDEYGSAADGQIIGEETVEIDMRTVLDPAGGRHVGSHGTEEAPALDTEASVGPAGDAPATDESLEWEIPDESRDEYDTHPEEQAGAEDHDVDDVLEETPDFLRETPEQERLWFEQRPPRDFDFNE